MLKNYVVLYRIESIMTPLDEPFGFQCFAEDSNHAEDQCLNAYGDCDVVWVHQSSPNVGMIEALKSYWNDGLKVL